MSLIHIGIYIILIAASYLAWKKYDDKLMRWCFWVGIIALAAWVWQFCAENLLGLPTSVQAASFFVVQALRLAIFILLVIAGIRILRPTRNQIV
jgi:hypothetical protein